MNRIICRSLLHPSSINGWSFQHSKNCSTTPEENLQKIENASERPEINYIKSQLEEKDYKRYHGIPTVLSPLEVDVTPLRKLREEYGKYGAASGIQEKYLWPSKQELKLMKEYEQVKNPLSLPDMIKKAKTERKESIKFAVNRQNEILENMKKLGMWKKVVNDNIEKKENESKQAKDKRERLIEEVRLMFGIRIDPQSEKFQEALAKKEIEEKKAEKALRKQQKQQKMLEQLKKIADAERMREANNTQSAKTDDGSEKAK